MYKIQEVPFREGLFVEDESGKPYLIGNKCLECGQKFFPPRPFCFSCSCEQMENVKLGNRGVIYSYSTSYSPSIMFDPPYVAGWIDVEEGLRIFAPLAVPEGMNLELGGGVELEISELCRKEDKIIIGYKYRPVAK